jgi:hypothetical protein
MRRSTDRLVAAAIATVAIIALVLQLVLILRNAGSTLATVVRYFSFFTILSNIWVAAVCIAVATCRGWVRSPVARGAAALYIAVTAGIYATLLQGLVPLGGAGLLADTLLHKIVPAMYLLAWLACAPHRVLRWSDVLRWLVFPLVYVGWIYLRGSAVHEYPYPFMDLTRFPGGQVAVNCVGVGMLFAALGLVLVAIDRWWPARRSR